MHAGTYDVNGITVENSSQPNTMELGASFVQDSPSQGVLFVLLWTEDGGGVDYSRSMFLAVRKSMADEHVRGNITRGHYTVLAFDIEEDGRVESGQNSPAAMKNVSIYGEGVCVCVYIVCVCIYA